MTTQSENGTCQQENVKQQYEHTSGCMRSHFHLMTNASSRVTIIPLKIVLSALGMCQLVAEFSVRQKVIQIRYRQLHIPLMDAAFCLDHSTKPSSSGIQQQARSSLVLLPLTRVPFDPSLSTHQAKHSSPVQMTKQSPSGMQIRSNPLPKVSTYTLIG